MGIARKALAVLFVALVLIGGVFAQSVREVTHGGNPDRLPKMLKAFRR